ncbi:MAG: SDR family NAD(P)-dependent oxidoreductase [Chloroflexota bacterium]
MTQVTETLVGLEGRTALVTGGGQGIGLATARLLDQLGARVAINYPDAGHRPSELAGFRQSPLLAEADIGDAASASRMVDEVVSSLGGLDVLVNNAGIFPRAAALELDEATWDRVFAVNLKGTFFCSQAAARHMVARRSGRIVNIASDAAIAPAARGAHYNASKAGVIALTKSLALEWAPWGVAVNAVAPGLTDTAQPRYGMSEAEIAAEGAAMPWGRIGQPEDVARAVAYLAGPMAEFVTGATVLVTGGACMAP